MAGEMYVPECFKETAPELIDEFLSNNPFGMLVTTHEGTPFVCHLPFMYEPDTGDKGRLLFHMARANSQWEHLLLSNEVLVVFQGPHAYVSPSWYVSPGVPTWNYAVVHVRGYPRIIESKTDVEAMLEQLTATHEQHMSNPWKSDGSCETRPKSLSMIVGFEVQINDVEAKFKLSQNRSVEERRRIAHELVSSNNQAAVAVGKLMGGDKWY